MVQYFIYKFFAFATRIFIMNFSSMINFMNKRLKCDNYGRIYIMRLLASWLLACITDYICFGKIFDKAYSGRISIPLFIVMTALYYMGLTFLRFIPKLKKLRTDSFLLLASFSVFAVIVTYMYFIKERQGIIPFISLVPFAALCIYYTLGKDRLKLPSVIKKCYIGIIVSAMVIMTVFTIGTTVARYYGLYAPSFDFGIFAQMFQNMKDTFSPVTTVERNYLLSHFAVHFSPAYYLLLPFYMLFPHPVTLQVLQGLLIASGVIPLFLISRKYNFSKMKCAVISVIYAFYPAFIGGCSYDMHENCMLLPFLLWLFWAIEREKTIPAIIFSILTLTVKEDAAVYVAVIGLYLMLSDRSKKLRILGAFIASGAVIYFVMVCAYLEANGLGIMTWRYNDYIPSADAGLIGVIISVITNPAYLAVNLFSGEKAAFIVQMIATLGFIPLVTKKFHRYILLIPFVLINLMPDYQYQHSIYFQYIFGTGAIMMWLFVMNLSELKYDKRKCMTALSALSCIIMTISTMSGMLDNLKYFSEEKTAVISYLETLPVTDKSITADTFFIPALYKQKELYVISTSGEPNNKTAPDADIVLLDRTRPQFEITLQYYKECGMTETEITGTADSRICRLERV